MSADVIQFVDSIAANPTVRLSLNDDDTFRCRAFLAPPPRLRRSMSQNAMTDGGYVSTSQYGTRTLVIELDLISDTQDDNAAALQRLSRELDRERSLIRYQPAGASAPVFFVLWRSDYASLIDIPAALAFRQVAIEIAAEPFALGLRETVSIGTITNDPAAATRGCYFEVSSIKGDVAAPLVIHETSYTHSVLHLGVRQHGTPSDMTWFKQCESMTAGTLTALAGSTDATLSGTGNNYMRTSFATPGDAMATRVTWNLPADVTTTAKKQALRGSYRVLVWAKQSVAGGTCSLRWHGQATGIYGPTVALAVSSSRQLVDLGVISFGDTATVGHGATLGVDATNESIELQASVAGSSGSPTLDWDVVMLVPADEMLHINANAVLSAPIDGYVIDSVNESLTPVVGDPYASGTTGWRPAASVTGGWPYVRPDQTNRFIFAFDEGLTASSKTQSASFAASYWPRYLHVRPATS